MSAPRTAVVSGGAGFICSHMVDLLLRRGYRVRVIDNLVSGREANQAHHAANAGPSFERMDVRECRSDSALFRDADCAFARVHRAVTGKP